MLRIEELKFLTPEEWDIHQPVRKKQTAEAVSGLADLDLKALWQIYISPFINKNGVPDLNYAGGICAFERGLSRIIHARAEDIIADWEHGSHVVVLLTTTDSDSYLQTRKNRCEPHNDMTLRAATDVLRRLLPLTSLGCSSVKDRVWEIGSALQNDAHARLLGLKSSNECSAQFPTVVEGVGIEYYFNRNQRAVFLRPLIQGLQNPLKHKNLD